MVELALVLLLVACALCAGAGSEDERPEVRAWAERALLGEKNEESPAAPGEEGGGPSRGVLSDEVPYSFLYDGVSSRELLASWERTQSRESDEEGRERHCVTYTDPVTKLEIRCEVTVFTDFPAVDWVMWLRNGDSGETPPLDGILGLDLKITLPSDRDVVLHHARGGTDEPADYLPLEAPVGVGADIRLAPQGGRSSNGVLPFFNLAWGDSGLVGAVGWSGQWEMRLLRDAGGNLALRAGQQTVRMRLQPGEEIRTPRILLLRWQGDRLHGHNLLRRLIYQRYTPLLGDEKPLPPAQCNTWWPVGDNGGLANARNQIELLEAYEPLGIECLVMDAGWYVPYGTPGGRVGTWEPDREKFPEGLKPVGEAARRSGIRFGMWFEPERVHITSQMAREHPEWLLKVKDNATLMILNLGLTEAQEWVIDRISRYVAEVPLGYYRHDFNIDPLPFWQKADTPDRVGATENHHIQGLYRLWDTLRARFPALLMEGCAAGDRRIDLESISRCHTSWKSDLFGNHTANQGHVHGASLYLPGNYLNTPLFELQDDPYPLRSMFGGALCLGWDPRLNKVGPYPASEFNRELAAEWMRQFKALRHLVVGDFYPLIEHSLRPQDWAGYQFHREDLGEGMVLFFRRESSIIAAVDARLRGLAPEGRYMLAFQDSGKTRHATGEDLSRTLRVTIDRAPGSALITYRRLG